MNSHPYALSYNKLYYLPGLENPRNVEIPAGTAEHMRQVCEADLEYFEAHPDSPMYERACVPGEAFPLEYPDGCRVTVVGPEPEGICEGVFIRLYRVFSHLPKCRGGEKAGSPQGIHFISDVWSVTGQHRHEYGIVNNLPDVVRRPAGNWGGTRR